jgi:hypothetical protein
MMRARYLAAVTTAASISALIAFTGNSLPLRAQGASETPSAYQAPPRRAKVARIDAYSGPSNTPGLGTLESTEQSTVPGSPSRADAPYASPYAKDAAASDGGANLAAPSSVERQGSYQPTYGSPSRPYGEVPSANNAPPVGNQGYASGYGSGGNDAYRAPNNGYSANTYSQQQSQQPYMSGGGNADRPYSGGGSAYGNTQAYQNPDRYNSGAGSGGGYGQPYSPPADKYERDYDADRPSRIPERQDRRDGTFSADEIGSTGHKFFGSVSQGLANVIEHAFKRQGRPNGYILGEEAGGAFVAGLRYGEGTLYTRDAGTHKVYWQGPSIGWDAGAAGSKVMVLVYNLRDPNEMFERFGGVDGSAYFVGGVGLTILKRDHITLAPIRSGVGLRLGANVGYLKYTPRPTWNPF